MSIIYIKLPYILKSSFNFKEDESSTIALNCAFNWVASSSKEPKC